MKAWWTRLATRVDALSPRERFMLFVVLVSLLGAATHLAFIAPLVSLQMQRLAQMDMRSAETEEQLIRVQTETLARRQALAAELGNQGAMLQSEIDGIEREIAQLSQSASESVALPAMLRRVLRRSDKVALVRVSPAADAAAAPGSAQGAAMAAAQGGGLDITLAGGYLDLMEYLATLEASLPLARWSALRVSAETVPPQAAVRIVTPRTAP